ncbi:MAG: glycosyltransferase [Nitrospirota bacterium]
MLTVLTQPVPTSPVGDGTFLSQPSAALCRLVETVFPGKAIYGGHPAVTRSVVEGLARLGVRHRYNPKYLDQVGRVVLVLAGLDTLQQAIAWKRAGRISTLLAGPNIVVRPTEYDGLIAAPEIDACIVPSQWVGTAYEEDAPTLAGRIKVWAAGVDERYWNGLRRHASSKTVLLYQKSAPEELGFTCERLIRSMGWSPVRVGYGCYKKDEYREVLASSVFAVFLSRSESQGLALAEAWAMNVPTLVWDPGEFTFEGRRYSTVSACPYLTSETGLSWETVTELEDVLTHVDDVVTSKAPRQWVLDHMTDEIAARNLLSMIETGRRTSYSPCPVGR